MPNAGLPEPYPSDTPVVQDGGRIKLEGEIRARAGWPKGDTSYPIIVELIEAGWVELQVVGRAEERRQRARRWAHASGKDSVSTYNLQAVDDVFQEATFNPRDGRFQLPGSVLAFLGIHPREPDPEPEPPKGSLREAAKHARRPLARYGGQEVYVQANEGSITVLSLERRRQRWERLMEVLPPEEEKS